MVKGINIEEIYYGKEYQVASKIPTERFLFIQWIRDLVYISEVLRAQIETLSSWNALYAQMFYIKLYGLIDEKQENTILYSAEDEYLKCVNKVISAIRKQLSNDEYIYIQYRRNSAAHPIQNSYDIFTNDGDIIRKTRDLQKDGEKISLSREDVSKAIGRILEINGNSDINFDIKIVKKLTPIILQMKEDLAKNYINSMNFFK